MAAATFVSILVNPCLIYYYKRFRTSWIHRYYYFLSIAQLCYAIFRGIPFTYELLLSPQPGSESWKWCSELMEIPAQLSSALVTTIVCVTVMVQYLNISHPLWTVINGTSQFRKYSILMIGSIYLTFYVPALVLLIVFRKENLLFNNQSNIYKAVPNLMFCTPTILFTIFSSCLYVITRVKFLALNPGEDQVEITRKEFRIINVFIGFGLVWMAFTITHSVLIFFKGADDFIILVCGKMEVLVQRAVIACAIFFNDNHVYRSYFLFCRFQNGAGYEHII